MERDLKYYARWGATLGILIWALPAGAVGAEDAAPSAEAAAQSHPPEDEFGPHEGPFGPGRHEGRPGAMLWRRMTEEERTALKEFMAAEYPEMYNRLLELEARDPDEFVPGIGRILPEMIRMKELRDRDPELFQIRKREQQTEFELRRLARRYRFAKTDEDRAALAEKIRPLVEQQFDIRQERMTAEVSRLEARIADLRQRIARQADDRDAEVEKMLERILEGGADIGPPPGGERGPRRHRGAGLNRADRDTDPGKQPDRD